MRKIVLLLAIVLMVSSAKADVFSWGIKGGINSSKLKFSDITINDPNNTANGLTFKPSSYEVGFHFGAFARVKIAMLYFQPELIYTNLSAGIDVKDPINTIGSSKGKLQYHNIDVPLMLGWKIGPGRFNLGPVMTFNVSKNLKEATAQAKETIDTFSKSSKAINFGGQVGVGLDILKTVTLDLKYEFGLSKFGDGVTIGGKQFATDQRQSQIIASLGIMF